MTIYFKITPGLKYTINRGITTSRFIYGFTKDLPQTGSSFLTYTADNSAESVSLIAPKEGNAEYIYAYVLNPSFDSLDRETVKNSMSVIVSSSIDFTARNSIDQNINNINELKDIISQHIVYSEWSTIVSVKGQYISYLTGKRGGSSKYMRGYNGLYTGYGYTIGVALTNNTYEYALIYYNTNGDIDTGDGYISGTEYKTGIQFIPEFGVKFNISIRRVDQADLTDTDVAQIKNSLYRLFMTDKSLSLENHFADAKTVGDEISNIYNYMNVNSSESKIPLSYTIGDGSISYSDGSILSAATVVWHTTFIDISEFEAILYRKIKTTIDSSNFGIAFYDNEYAFIENSGIPALCKAASFGYISEMELCYVPENAVYVRCSTADPEIHGEFLIYGIPKVKDIPLGLHTMPQNIGAYNVIRNARQNTDIHWTPAADIPRTSIAIRGYTEFGGYAYFRDVFLNNKEYTGVPYGTPGATLIPRRNIFGDRNIETFLTAVVNPNSVEAIESRYSTTTGSYYASNCTIMCCYCLNTPAVNSDDWDHIPGIRKIMDVISNGVRQNLNNIKLADFLHIDGHVAVVTDIIKDKNKVIQYIEVSEQTRSGNMNRDYQGSQYGGKARRLTWNPEDFYKQFGSYDVLRYDYLDNVKYTPSKYIPMVDEGKRHDFINLPLVPYYGNKAYLLSGSVCKLLIAVTGFTHLFIKKNGVAWNENGTTDPYDVTNLTYIDINCDEDEAVYTAFLAIMVDGNIDNNTVECTWYVEGNINIITSMDTTEQTVSFTVGLKTNSFKPWFVNLRANQDVKNGYNRLIFDQYESIIEPNTEYPYKYTFTQSWTQQPSKYVIGMWSDEFGSMYSSGSF